MRKMETIEEKNLDLAHQFLLYSFEHPDVLDRIPAGAEVVFFPAHDKKLLAANKRLVERFKKVGQRFVIFQMIPTKRKVVDFQPIAA